jgi:hypothetical protein
MAPRIINCEQGTEEWFRVRAGMPTASMFSTVMAKGRSGGESATRRTYMLKLAGEILTGEPAETFSNAHTERGKVMEEDARNWYAFNQDVEPERVGFIINGPKGCSPDSLIGSDGMVEFKTALPHILIEKLLKNEFSPEHKAQCQGALWVAEREWIDLVTYWPRLPPLRVRAFRDEVYIAAMSRAVDEFNEELAEVVERIRSYDARAAA